MKTRTLRSIPVPSVSLRKFGRCYSRKIEAKGNARIRGSDLTAYRTWLAVPATLGLSLRTPSVAKDDLTILRNVLYLCANGIPLSIFLPFPIFPFCLVPTSIARSTPHHLFLPTSHSAVPWPVLGNIRRIWKLNNGATFFSSGRNGPR